MNIKQALYLVAFGLMIGLSVLGVKHLKDWYDLKSRAESSVQIGKTTSDLNQDGEKADEDRGKVAKGLDEGRDQFERDYEGAKRDEPEVATRASRTVPVRVRDTFRKRRLARERLGCVGTKCETRPGEDSSAER